MRKKKTVAFIPIKLNSQRLPNKNKLAFGDKPLCYHISNTLTEIENIDEVYVYCSDADVLNYVPSKVKFLKRDQCLDGDMVKGKEIYEAFINTIDSDVYILAHTTSPFTKVKSVQNALDKVLFEGYDSAMSVQKIQTFAWHKDKPINYDLNDVPRTQDIEPVYVETSGFFIFEKKVFVELGRRIGEKPYLQVVDHLEAIDIDTREDYDFAIKLI